MAGLTRGPKGKLTPELEARIIELFRGGSSFRATAAACRLDPNTLFTWLKRGKAEKSGVYRDFYERAMEARGQLEQLCLRTVRLAITGGWFDSPVYDRDGRPVPQCDPETGEPVKDEKGRVVFQMLPEFTKPDANLALRVMARINRSEWGTIDEDQPLPDPSAEFDKAPSEQIKGESDHKKISTSTLAKAVAFLAEQGVPIPGMVADPKKAKEAEVEDAEVVGEVPAGAKPVGGDQILIGGPNVKKS